LIARRYVVRGRVQGVGFRFFVSRHAEAFGVRGWVRNIPDGTVEAVAAGDEGQLESFEQMLAKGPFMARVDGLDKTDTDPPSEPSFRSLRTPT
jgi:acylphosphatase